MSCPFVLALLCFTSLQLLYNWCFNRESKTYLCTSVKAGVFLATRNMSRINVGLARSYVKLLLSSWKTYMCNLMAWYINKKWGFLWAPIVLQIADLFLYCYERDFISDLQKSKRFDLIDMFNDISQYLDDIFTIDNPEFEKHISDIYPAELQLNKANTSDQETSLRFKYKSYW